MFLPLYEDNSAIKYPYAALFFFNGLINMPSQQGRT